MHHRTRELRAAVARRDRSQGHLRAVTATVGVGGVVTAGAVAFILPGATHTAASTQPARAAQPTATTSQAAPATGTGNPGTAATRRARRHHHHHKRAGGAAAGSAGAASASTAPAPPSSAPAPVPSTSPSHGVSGGS
jgi:hypothetical protein